MKINRDELIEKLADRTTDAADLDSLISFFRDSQIHFLSEMSDKELVEYANEFLGYDVEEETI